MKVTCEYCGSFIESTDEMCPNCGAVNTHFVRTAVDTPTTIKELKDFCASKNLPLDRMHIHIGEDYKAPKAFGIYFDEKTGHYVVYKNKADGTRAIRYEGADEKYAVNELYLKIKDMILDKREQNLNNGSAPRRPNNVAPKNKKLTVGKIILIVIAILFILGVIGELSDSGKNGYYSYGGKDYYRHGNYWYAYDDDDEVWSEISDPGIDSEYFVGKGYDNDYSFDEFPVNDYSSDWGSSSDWDFDWDSDSDSDWDSDWDSDSDWGSDSWDTGSDWGSDSGWDSDWFINIISFIRTIFIR